jgi:hypothetical protein
MSTFLHVSIDTAKKDPTQSENTKNKPEKNIWNLYQTGLISLIYVMIYLYVYIPII